MARRSRTEPASSEDVTLAPPPLSGGIDYHDSLGRLIDNLMGDRRDTKRAHEDMRDLISDEVPDDPPPSEVPPPIPGGSDPITKGDNR